MSATILPFRDRRSRENRRQLEIISSSDPSGWVATLLSTIDDLEHLLNTHPEADNSTAHQAIDEIQQELWQNLGADNPSDD